MRSLVLLAVFLFAVSQARDKFETKTFGLEDLIKFRCSLDSDDETLFYFNGTVIGYPEQQQPRVLFKTIGMNIGRCFKRSDSSYTLTSRELLFYLDPTTEQLLKNWTNPWTNETVNVVHVANDPVQQNYPNTSTFQGQVNDDSTIFPLDIPLFYPNPLYGNASYVPYSPQRWYQAGEFFKFIVPTKDLKKKHKDTIDDVLVSWTRTGPWLPWMKQGEAHGYLLYSSQGAKIPSLDQLPWVMQEEIENRVQVYQSAPTCVLNASSVSSWTYFKKYFDAYIAGAEFPIPSSSNTSPCVAL